MTRGILPGQVPREANPMYEGRDGYVRPSVNAIGPVGATLRVSHLHDEASPEPIVLNKTCSAAGCRGFHVKDSLYCVAHRKLEG